MWALVFENDGRFNYPCKEGVSVNGQGFWLAKSAAETEIEHHLHRVQPPDPGRGSVSGAAVPDPGIRIDLIAFIDAVLNPDYKQRPFVCSAAAEKQQLSQDDRQLDFLPFLKFDAARPAKDNVPHELVFPEEFAYVFTRSASRDQFISFMKTSANDARLSSNENGSPLEQKFKRSGLLTYHIYLRPGFTLTEQEQVVVNAAFNDVSQAGGMSAEHVFSASERKWAKQHPDSRMLYNYLSRFPGAGSTGMANPCDFLRLLDASLLVGWTTKQSKHDNLDSFWPDEQRNVIARFHAAYLARGLADPDEKRRALLGKVPPISDITSWPHAKSIANVHVATCNTSHYEDLPAIG